MSSVAERITAKASVSSLELDTSYDLNGEDETDFYEEPPCLCAQQIISTLFGTILGYLGVLLTPAQIYFPIAIAQVTPFNFVNIYIKVHTLITLSTQGMGITLGLLGSEKSNIKAMGLREPIVVSIVLILSTYIVITLAGAFNDGEISLGTLVWTSFLLSNLASWVRSCTRYPQYNTSSNFSSPEGSAGTGSPFPSPQKLKHKHSGDSYDWFGKNGNIMKV